MSTGAAARMASVAARLTPRLERLAPAGFSGTSILAVSDVAIKACGTSRVTAFGLKAVEAGEENVELEDAVA
jgi:hypothetical protein